MKKTDRIYRIYRDAQKDLGMIVVKSLGMCVASVIPITVVSAVTGLLLTPFPMFAGFMTAIMVQTYYVAPRTRKVAKFYEEKLKQAIEEAARDQD